jgi:hypothetical protein
VAKGRLTRANYNAIRDHLFDRIHKNGEQLKNDFPNILRKAIEAEVWTHFVDSEGMPFENLVDWLHHSFPNGASMGQGQHSITYEEALKLTEGASDVHRVLAETAPKTRDGRDRKSKTAKSEAVSSANNDIRRFATGKMTLSVRLAQEKPKFYDAYLRGDYKSITAAATAAGLLKDDLNLRRAKSAFRMMTAEQRQEFLQWMSTESAEKANPSQ